MGCTRGAVVAVCAVVSLAPFAPMVAQNLSIAEVMTPSQLEETGVAGLSPAQRAALDRWFAEYTRRVLEGAKGLEAPTGGTPATYAGIGSAHWVMKVSGGGRLVLLEDGSLWEVQTADRIHAGIWSPMASITVIAAGTPSGDYRYALFNKDRGDTVMARFLGK